MKPRFLSTRRRIFLTLLAAGLVLVVGVIPTQAAKIHLKPSRTPTPETESSDQFAEPSEEEKRGFDYETFERRLQSHWFQRKALLTEGRTADASLQADRIRAFCTAEGIGRLQDLADALILESEHHLERGQFTRAFDALRLAGQLDPGRPQVHITRAWVIWKSGQGGIFSAISEYLTGFKAAIVQSVIDFRLPNRVLLAMILAIVGTATLFSVLMMLRYQVPFRHQVEEWFAIREKKLQGKTVGWILLTLPALLWFTAGWIGFYWIAAMFRFMQRSEKTAAILLLIGTAACLPMYRVSVALYGMTTDPVVRATLEAASGPYSPDRIVEMQKLVNAYPQDATFRFLLAGLYAKGQYFNEAFQEYQRALEVDPNLYQAVINLGNIYYELQNFDEAGAFYLRVLETHPDSVLALYNLYRSHAEGFRFTESETALNRARSLDSEKVTRLMAGAEDGRSGVVSADLNLGSIWTAAFEGGTFRTGDTAGVATGQGVARVLNPVSIVAILTLILSLVLAATAGSRSFARRCIRCGRAFCNRCKTGKEGHEYCSQCLHLFVLGDGLAPETKTLKLFEVERHEKWTRLVRKYSGWLFPGASQILRGRLLSGCLLMIAWFTAVLTCLPVAFRPIEWVTGFDLRLDLLFSGQVPAVHTMHAAVATGFLTAVLTWILAVVGRGGKA